MLGQRFDLAVAHVDDAVGLVAQESGNTFEVPWDDVLYHCEPDYPYYKGRESVETNEEQSTRIGERIRGLREQQGLSVADLAALVGMKRPNLSRLEHGRHTPSLETLERIADGLGVPVAQLIVRD